MKDNKICFNKTLTYLILLVGAVVGAFYVMNYANNQKVTQNTEAAAECRQGGVKGHLVSKSIYSTCTAYQNTYKVTMTALSAANKTVAGKDYICCIPGKSLGGGSVDSSNTCKAKGGSDWFRDTSATALKTRLETPNTTVTVNEITGTLSDASMYPGRKCYKVSYKYKTESGQSCKQQGGNWYSDASSTALDARLTNPSVDVTVTEVTSPNDVSYYPGKKCYRVAHTYKVNAGQSCKQQGGNWYRDTTETALEARLETDEYTVPVTLITNPSDASYYPGRFCYKLGNIVAKP